MIDGRAMGAIALTFLLASLTLPATPQTPARVTLGPSQCVRCHTPQAAWWVNDDGPPPRGHVSTLLQLETADARRYAQRLGLADVYATSASCVTCHATVFRGDAREGVSCESCHGAGSAYLEVHAQPGAYRLAVDAGMTDLVGNVKAWTTRCLECHLITDAPLVAAGHSTGKTFNLADKYRVVAKHWKQTYQPDAVAAAAREATIRMLAASHGR
jgi:hypothetical protein